MDGLQGRLKTSLQFRLSLWLSLLILGVALVAGAVSFLVAFNEANELQDDMLRQAAALFDAQHLPVSPSNRHWEGPADEDPEARLLVTILTATAKDPAVHRPLFPPDLSDGIQTYGLDGQTWRVFVTTLGPGERIAVAQQTAVRDETARYSALLSLTPFLILVPILLIVIAWLVRTMFAPIAALAAALDQRGEGDLQALPACDLPREIRPFVVAINRLLERVADSIAVQQRFVAAAAHELRSPLTALSLQAERLAEADMSEAARPRLAVLRQGIERNRMLLDQLLVFSRAQAAVPTATTVTSIQDVVREILADLMPLIEAKRLDIGMDSQADAALVVSPFDLTLVLKNLIANAIHYTPSGGRIDLSITDGVDTVTIAVEDNGPGIAQAQRTRVFEPFYRGLGTEVVGSGLGLSIVKTVVDRLGGRVTLANATRSHSGLRATIIIPRSDQGRLHQG